MSSVRSGGLVIEQIRARAKGVLEASRCYASATPTASHSRGAEPPVVSHRTRRDTPVASHSTGREMPEVSTLSGAGDKNDEDDKSDKSEKNDKIDKNDAEADLDEITEPTNCCMSGCANCVWIQYAERLSRALERGDVDMQKVIMERVHDPNMRAFLAMELRCRKLMQ